MPQELQRPNILTTKPGSLLAIVSIVLALVVIVLLALVVYLAFGRATASPTAVARSDAPSDERLIEEPKGTAPTVLDYPLPYVPPGLVESPDAAGFTLAGLQFLTIHFDDQWQTIDQNHNVIPKSGYPIITSDLWELQAQWTVLNGRLDCVQALKRTGPDQFSYDAKFTSATGVQSQLVCTEIKLPLDSYVGEQIMVDGTALKFPETLRDRYGKVADIRSFKKLEIATSVGRLIIEGAGGLSVADLRAYGHDAYTIQLHFTPARGLLTQTELHLKMKVVPN